VVQKVHVRGRRKVLFQRNKPCSHYAMMYQKNAGKYTITIIYLQISDACTAAQVQCNYVAAVLSKHSAQKGSNTLTAV